jgi:hypothetical protein
VNADNLVPSLQEHLPMKIVKRMGVEQILTTIIMIVTNLVTMTKMEKTMKMMMVMMMNQVMTTTRKKKRVKVALTLILNYLLVQ